VSWQVEARAALDLEPSDVWFVRVILVILVPTPDDTFSGIEVT